MAAVSVVAADVGVGNDAILQVVQVGFAASHGDPIYLDSTDNKHKLATATNTTQANCRGICLTSAASDGHVVMLRGGVFLMSGLTADTDYFIDSAGGIAPRADLSSGNAITRLGIAASATELRVNIDATGLTI